MFKKKYIYLIVYIFKKDDDKGVGSATVERDSKIKTIKEIRDLEKQLECEDNFHKVVIINFQILS